MPASSRIPPTGRSPPVLPGLDRDDLALILQPFAYYSMELTRSWPETLTEPDIDPVNRRECSRGGRGQLAPNLHSQAYL